MCERICIMLSGLLPGFLCSFMESFFSFQKGSHRYSTVKATLSFRLIAVTGLKLYFLAVFFAGTNISMAIYFTSTNRALPAHVISLLRGLRLIVPAAFLLARLLGICGVWLSYPVTEGLAFLLGVDNLLCIQTKECIPDSNGKGSTAMQWTEAQAHTIVSRGKNILVPAAAGSGKTAVLIERIKQLVFTG